MMKVRRICNVPKCTTRGHDRKGWIFPLVGGPYDKIYKYRLYEPLIEELHVPHHNGHAVYVKTDFPESERWRVKYVYSEDRTRDVNRSGCDRA